MSKKHSIEQISRVLLKLQANNFNVTQTQIETGISRVSIRKWKNQYGTKLYNIKKEDEIILENGIIKPPIFSIDNISKKLLKVIDLTLDKLIIELELEKARLTAHQLIALLEKAMPFILPKFVSTKTNNEGDVNNYNVIFNNYVQEKIFQLNNATNEEQNNFSIKRTAEELPGGDE